MEGGRVELQHSARVTPHGTNIRLQVRTAFTCGCLCFFHGNLSYSYEHTHADLQRSVNGTECELRSCRIECAVIFVKGLI